MKSRFSLTATLTILLLFAAAGGADARPTLALVERSQDARDHAMWTFNPTNGNLRLFWSLEGITPAQIIDGPDDTLLISDFTNIRVADSEGFYQRDFLSKSLLPSQFYGMERIGNRTYVTSDAATRIYDDEGNEVESFINGSRDVVGVGNAIVTISSGRLFVYSGGGTLRRTLDVIGYRMHQAVRLEGDGDFVLAVAAEEPLPGGSSAKVLKFRKDGSFVALDIAGEIATGLYQLPSGGDLMVAGSAGVGQYALDGTFQRTVLGVGPVSTSRLMYLTRIDNFEL